MMNTDLRFTNKPMRAFVTLSVGLNYSCSLASRYLLSHFKVIVLMEHDVGIYSFGSIIMSMLQGLTVQKSKYSANYNITNKNNKIRVFW